MHLQNEPALIGTQVSLFQLQPEHVTDNYVAWLNDTLVNRYLECRFIEHSLQSTKDFVERCCGNSQTLLLGISARTLGGRHIGNVKIGPTDQNHKTAEVGIMIGDRDAWGKGFGTDAIKLAMRLAKHTLKLRRLTAGCYQSNIGSQRAFTNAGFSVEGVRPGHFLLDGQPESLVLLGCDLDHVV